MGLQPLLYLTLNSHNKHCALYMSTIHAFLYLGGVFRRCNERESNSMPLFNISLIPILLQGFSKTKFCENFVILGKNVMRCDFFHAFVLSRIWHLFRGGILFSIILGVQCVSVRMTLHHLLKSSNNSCKNFRNSRIVRCSWIQFANMISLNHRYYI